ncbi:PXA domain containing protein [Coccidioides posadasii C735 delta SOWgp]|uniref:PXA domain containing protein n=1 Tax=Coccidioides posadasii (strain C735) TaxID=222929 RepID=C5P948_COCP7|nr:PXA domain containing protein [Coccidioides posadasii C735 delta SOWgp]EER26260.1 PXA domain containing protein [Coccidioides posadasii C735 delta SOWgp]|eukprot:XP_003068405.1 PXA domain containing protein [Coccidioides posadasii C735 delta SOWgp]
MTDNLQLFSKFGPTASDTTASTPPRRSPAGSRAISHARHGPKFTTQTDFTSERATRALILRVLCAQVPGHGSEQRDRGTPRPLEEILPPLTSSNEVDLQLYALIAIIMKEFVYLWYSKITPDHSFTEEIIQVIAHCTRALEQRLRQIDIHALVLDEIPSLIEAHVIAYRMADQSAMAARSQAQFRIAYHALNPHPALSPVPSVSNPASVVEQQERESIYRQMLAQGILAVLLPTEDLENVCLRTLVGDILADLLLGEIVGGKVVEGWFIWEVITKLAGELRPGPEEANTEMEDTEMSQPGRVGLLSTRTDTDPIGNTSAKTQSSLSLLLWSILQYAYLAYAAIRFVARELTQVASPSSFMPVRGLVPETTSKTPATETQSLSSSSTVRLPILKYRIFGMAARLVDVSRRMPWLGGSLALVQHVLLSGPGRLGETDGAIDR